MTLHRPYLAMFYMAFAMFLYTTGNGLLKLCDQNYAIVQILFFLFFFALFPCLFFEGTAILKTRKISLKTYGVRGAASTLRLGCLYGSIYLLPFSDAVVLMFASTPFLVVFSGPILGEKIARAQWFAVAVGFLGILIVASPSGDVHIGGIILGVTSACIEAALMLQSRILTRSDSNTTIVFYSALVGAIIGLCVAPFFWKTPTLKDAFILIFIGVSGGFGQYFQTCAYRYASAGTLGPVIYTAMIWSTIYSYFFFNELMTTALLGGGALIILSGLIVIYCEKR